MNRSEAVDAVMTEVDKATRKFPTWPDDPLHAVAVIGEELGELTQAVLECTYEPHKSTREDVRKEAVQVAAMAVRFLMSLDVYDYKPGGQHEQKTAAVMAEELFVYSAPTLRA